MMKKNQWFKISALAAAVLIVGLAIFTAVDGTVSADEITPNDPNEIVPGEGFGRGPAGRGGRGSDYGSEVFLQSVADQSGIALEDLQAALENRERLETVLTMPGLRSLIRASKTANSPRNRPQPSSSDWMMPSPDAPKPKPPAAPFMSSGRIPSVKN
jgi:hypothetical protein